MAKWGFDTTAKRYRDLGSGRFLPKRQVVAIRDAVVDAAGQEARSLAERAARGEIAADAFRAGMRVAIRNSHVAQYTFGRGGINAMTPADFGRIGRTLRQQYAYLDRFVIDLRQGTVSEAQAANRAKMYVDSGVKAFEQGHASAWGIATQLPTYPGDTCEGRSNCRCSWDIRETDAGVECTWRLGGNDPCGPCRQNAARYNPYVVPSRWAQPETGPVRLSAIRSVA